MDNFQGKRIVLIVYEESRIVQYTIR
jgi:hypothetical protein